MAFKLLADGSSVCFQLDSFGSTPFIDTKFAGLEPPDVFTVLTTNLRALTGASLTVSEGAVLFSVGTAS